LSTFSTVRSRTPPFLTPPPPAEDDHEHDHEEEEEEAQGGAAFLQHEVLTTLEHLRENVADVRAAVGDLSLHVRGLAPAQRANATVGWGGGLFSFSFVVAQCEIRPFLCSDPPPPRQHQRRPPRRRRWGGWRST
jgi:hypothetical protein